MRKANLKIHIEKCNFGKHGIKYLGHVVNKKGIKTDDDKIKAIVYYPAPKTVEQLKKFSGITLWDRRFMKDYTENTAPLTKLLRKKLKWIWNDEQMKAFGKIRTLLTQAPTP